MKKNTSVITLKPYREVILIFFAKRIIGVFKKGGVDFIIKATTQMKQKAIYELRQAHYISGELAEFLFDKYCFCNAKKIQPVGEGKKEGLHIHLNKYRRTVLIFKNDYSVLLAVFQNNNLDFVDEDGVYLNTKKKVVELLKDYSYIDKKQSRRLLKKYCQE